MKIYDRLKIVIFIAVLTIPSIIWGVYMLAGDPDDIAKQYEDMENKENRSLAQWPQDDDLSGYTAKIEAYYNDRVPFRAGLLTVSADINDTLESGYREGLRPVLIDIFYGGRGEGQATLDIPELTEADWPVPDGNGYDTDVTNAASQTEGEQSEAAEHEYIETAREEATCEEDGYILYECKDCGESYEEVIPAAGHQDELVEEREASYMSYGHKLYRCSVCGRKRWTDIEAKLVDTSYFPLTIENNYTIMGRYNWLFYRGDASLSYYTGGNLMSEEEMREHLDMMRELKDICDDKGIKLVYMFMPNKEQVYSEYMPTMEIQSEKKRLDVFMEYAKENYADVNVIYPIKELKETKVYYDTYFAYDTHWNKVGAFVGTMALYKALGMETTDLGHVETEPTDFVALGLVQTGALPIDKYTDDHDNEVHYKTGVELTWEEGTKDPIFGYTPVYRCTTTSENEEKCVFIGDSFRMWMIPYLDKDFSSLCMVQRENISDAEADIREADVLVLSAVERFDKDLFNRLPKLIKILSQEQ